jgi:hypothetical protein
MSRRISTAAAASPAALKPAGLLPVIASHILSSCDLQLACDISDLLRESIGVGTRGTYSCGFKSLSAFCKEKNLCALPVDAVTLIAWMTVSCQRIAVKSVIKYICGIRFAHIMGGVEWTLTAHPLVKIAITSLKKKYPSSNILQKIPLSLSMLLQMCQCMHGWPSTKKLSFNDLVWATASCIAFFACLRGGEFFVQPKADRPILTGAAVSLRSSLTGPFVFVEVPSPKTRKDLISIPAIAASPMSNFVFDPVLLLQAYRERAACQKINVLGKNAAFKSSDGSPINRLFMVSRAESLRAKAKISILDTAGKPIKVSAASWRAGFVMSARQAGVMPDMIRNNGRWTSVGGPLPYTVETLDNYQQMTKSLVSTYTLSTLKGASSAGGQFASSSLLL